MLRIVYMYCTHICIHVALICVFQYNGPFLPDTGEIYTSNAYKFQSDKLEMFNTWPPMAWWAFKLPSAIDCSWTVICHDNIYRRWLAIYLGQCIVIRCLMPHYDIGAFYPGLVFELSSCYIARREGNMIFKVTPPFIVCLLRNNANNGHN